MAEWIEYTGSDEQIEEIWNGSYGFLVDNLNKIQEISNFISKDQMKRILDTRAINHYLVIPYDPLREMKIRQAMTGQPVWWRFSDTSFEPGVRCTTSPDWNIPNAEYSFAPFED